MSKQSIKATIDANIKQNGNQEITGNILNSVLNAMNNEYGKVTDNFNIYPDKTLEVIAPSFALGATEVYFDGDTFSDIQDGETYADFKKRVAEMRILSVDVEEMVKDYGTTLDDLAKKYTMINVTWIEDETQERRMIATILPSTDTEQGWLYEYCEGWRLCKTSGIVMRNDLTFGEVISYFDGHSERLVTRTLTGKLGDLTTTDKADLVSAINEVDEGVAELNNEVFGGHSSRVETLSPAKVYDHLSYRADSLGIYSTTGPNSTAFYRVRSGSKVEISIPKTPSNFYASVFSSTKEDDNFPELPAISTLQLGTKTLLAKGNNSALTYTIDNVEGFTYIALVYVTANGVPSVTQSYMDELESRVVKVTPQVFTDYEKETAKTNLGIVDGRRSLKVLVMGNSFSQDSFGYAPFIVKAIQEKVDLTIGICVIGGCKMVQHCANFTNQAQTLDGTSYSPTNYAYFEYVNGANAWSNSVSKSASEVLALHDWDVVTFQQNGYDNYRDYATYYEPFCNKTFKALNAMVAKPVKIGWLLTHGSYVWTRADALRHWEGSRTNSQKVMNETSASIIFPYGTAIENLRTTSITTSYKDALLADDAHLQEGISTLCAGYSIAISLLKLLDYNAVGIWGEQTRPTLEWLNARNIPGMNFAQSGVVEGITEDNCRLAQAAAIKAEMRPYEVTDISSW